MRDIVRDVVYGNWRLAVEKSCNSDDFAQGLPETGRGTGERLRFASSFDHAVRDGPYKGNGEEGLGPSAIRSRARRACVYIQMLRRVILARARTGMLRS